MPINGFVSGRDLTTSIQTPKGPLKPTKVVGFSAKQETVDTKVKGLDGTITPLRFQDGWTGSFEVERQDSTVDDYFASVEADYYSGLNEQGAQITQTITEPGGLISQYVFTDCMLKADSLGDWAQDKTVNMKISFVANRRLKQ